MTTQSAFRVEKPGDCLASTRPDMFNQNVRLLAYMKTDAAVELVAAGICEAHGMRDMLRLAIAEGEAALAGKRAALARIEYSIEQVEAGSCDLH
jgi:hypothetical protein